MNDEEAFSNAYQDLMSMRHDCQEIRKERQDQAVICAECLIHVICKREFALSREHLLLECLNARRACNEQNICDHCGNRQDCANLTTKELL